MKDLPEGEETPPPGVNWGLNCRSEKGQISLRGAEDAHCPGGLADCKNGSSQASSTHPRNHTGANARVAQNTPLSPTESQPQFMGSLLGSSQLLYHGQKKRTVTAFNLRKQFLESQEEPCLCALLAWFLCQFYQVLARR